MKLIKKISYTFLALFLVLSFLQGQASKKPLPYSLKVLTDPDSPSFVPFPYPKTDVEIIEDFKYGIKILFGSKEQIIAAFLRGDSDDVNLGRNLFGDNPSWKVARIIKVKDLIERSPNLHYFILPIVNKKGTRVAVGVLADCGLWMGVECRSEGLKSKPYKTKKQVKELVRRTHGHFIEINEMERVNIRSLEPYSSIFSPLWKVKTPLGILFVDYLDDNVYQVELEIPCLNGPPLVDFMRHGNAVHDPLNDRMYLLRKIEK
ncbi:hypothetical protein ES703_11853 [subsurface metagenome]